MPEFAAVVCFTFDDIIDNKQEYADWCLQIRLHQETHFLKCPLLCSTSVSHQCKKSQIPQFTEKGSQVDNSNTLHSEEFEIKISPKR